MGKKYILLLLILVMLALLSGVYVVVGVQAYSRYRQKNSLTDQEHCGGQTSVSICVSASAAIISAFYPTYLATQRPLFNVSSSSKMIGYRGG